MHFEESSPSFSPESIPSRDWSGPAMPLALGPVVEAPAGAVVATDPVSVDADCDNETALQFQACPSLGKPQQKVFPRTRENMGQRKTDPAIWFLTS